MYILLQKYFVKNVCLYVNIAESRESNATCKNKMLVIYIDNKTNKNKKLEQLFTFLCIKYKITITHHYVHNNIPL